MTIEKVSEDLAADAKQMLLLAARCIHWTMMTECAPSFGCERSLHLI